MKFSWFAVGLFLLAFFAAGLTGAAAEALHLTYNPMPFNLPCMVERSEGLLEAQGLSVEYHTFLVGYAMTEAMAARELDIAKVMGATSAITSRAGGRSIRILNAYSQAPQAFALVAKPDTLSLDSLAGSRIALPLGTEVHFLLAKILEEQGLTLADVELINMLVPDGVAALQAGDVDGAMIVEPVLTRLKNAGQVEIVRDGSDLIMGLTVTVVREDFADLDALSAFKEAHRQSVAFIDAYPEEALAIASLETDLPLQLVENIRPKYSFEYEITEDIRAQLVETAEFLYREGVIRQPVTLEDLLF